MERFTDISRLSHAGMEWHPSHPSNTAIERTRRPKCGARLQHTGQVARTLYVRFQCPRLSLGQAAPRSGSMRPVLGPSRSAEGFGLTMRHPTWTTTIPERLQTWRLRIPSAVPQRCPAGGVALPDPVVVHRRPVAPVPQHRLCVGEERLSVRSLGRPLPSLQPQPRDGTETWLGWGGDA